GADLSHRHGPIAASLEQFLKLEGARIADHCGRLSRLVAQHLERPAVEPLEAVGRLVLDPAQRRDLTADRKPRGLEEALAILRVRVRNHEKAASRRKDKAFPRGGTPHVMICRYWMKPGRSATLS